jgi:hypothetical protein
MLHQEIINSKFANDNGRGFFDFIPSANGVPAAIEQGLSLNSNPSNAEILNGLHESKNADEFKIR